MILADVDNTENLCYYIFMSFYYAPSTIYFVRLISCPADQKVNACKVIRYITGCYLKDAYGYVTSTDSLIPVATSFNQDDLVYLLTQYGCKAEAHTAA